MPDSPEELMDRAYEYLDSYDLENAITLGRKLVEMRYSGGYEILGLAYAQDDKLDEAIEVLEEGVRDFSNVWLLWQQLGNYYSDREYYEKALDAYRQSLECDHVRTSFVHLNIAVCLSRQGKFNESNAELLFVDEEEMFAARDSVRMGNYVALKRWDDILAAAPDIVARLEEMERNIEEHYEYENLVRDLSAVYARWAVALLKGKKDRDASREALMKSLQRDKLNELALAVLRELDGGRVTKKDRLYRLMVQGTWNEPFEGEDTIPGFFTTYWVVAESEQEALEFARQIEPPEVAGSLVLEEFEEEDVEQWQEYKGVYSRSPYAFFSDDEDDEAEADAGDDDDRD